MLMFEKFKIVSGNRSFTFKGQLHSTMPDKMGLEPKVYAKVLFQNLSKRWKINASIAWRIKQLNQGKSLLKEPGR